MPVDYKHMPEFHFYVMLDTHTVMYMLASVYMSVTKYIFMTLDVFIFSVDTPIGYKIVKELQSTSNCCFFISVFHQWC